MFHISVIYLLDQIGPSGVLVPASGPLVCLHLRLRKNSFSVDQICHIYVFSVHYIGFKHKHKIITNNFIVLLIEI